MCDCEQHHVTSTTVIGSSRRRISLSSLDYAEDGLYLPALPVDGLIKTSLHEAAISTACRLGGWAAVAWRYERADTKVVTAELMV